MIHPAKNRLASGISAFAIAAALVVATPAAAQTDLATLQGHVAGGKAGTQVVATDTQTGQRATAQVDANGDYRILGLRPSTYSVAIEGMPAQETTLLVGQTATVDFGQEEGAAIVVTGQRGAILNVRTQTVTTNVTPAQIENLPQNQRNFLSFAALAPGVTVPPGGVAQVQAGALSSSNVNVLLDGMSIKNPINHGGVFGQNFGLGNPFPEIAVQEYRVDTQNFGAETGQAGSAVITAITKTGGNAFHGSAFIEYQPKSFITQPYFDKKNHVPKPEYSRKQFGGELGGPIIPGHLFFYVAGEGTIENLPSATGNVTVPIPGGLASQINISHNKDFKQGLYFGKLTWLTTDSDTINLEAFIRRENNLSDIDANATSSHGRTILTHQTRFQGQWKHSSGDFLNLLNVAYDKATQSTPSVGDGPEFNLSSGTNFGVIAITGSHFFTQGDSQKSWTVKDDMTLVRGDHTFKAGAQIVFFDLSRSVNNSFNGRYYFVNPGAGGSFDPTTAIPYGAQINIQPSPTLNAKDTQIGLYVQDEWKPDEHWTINAGIRWDFESNANNNNYVTPAPIAAALRAYPGWKARGIDPEDYISDGNNRHPYWKEFQPRLGVSYDVKGDRDLVLFAGAGRYYDRPLFIDGVLETLTNSNRIVTVNFCNGYPAGTAPAGCINFTDALRDPNSLRTAAAALAGSGGGDVWLLNNKTKIPYSDQFDLGIRKMVGPVRVSLIFSHIESHNIFQYVRANFYTNGWYTRFLVRNAAGQVIGCTDGGDTWIQDIIPNDTFAGCPAGGGLLPGYTGKLNRGASKGRARYNALYLTVEKPFTERTTWGVQGTLTIQRARSNVAQELNSDEFFNGPYQNVYGWGYVNSTEKWRLKTVGIVRAPLDIIASADLTLSSGPAFGNIIFGNAPDGACCYANMGGVFFPKPFIGYKRLDLRVAKTFKMPWGHDLTVDFEAFNVFNWLNRTYSSWGAGSGSPAPRIENGQVGNDGRQFQAGLRYAF